MAGVLGGEIYGPLTTKQREYLEIIEQSGQYLLSLVTLGRKSSQTLIKIK